MRNGTTKRIGISSAVVSLALISIGAIRTAEPAANVVEVTIVDLSFRPDSVTIKVGQTVRWINKDGRDHILLANDQSFKSPNMSPGDKFENKFTEAGKFEYRCVYRPRMTGTVVVEAAE